MRFEPDLELILWREREEMTDEFVEISEGKSYNKEQVREGWERDRIDEALNR